MMELRYDVSATWRDGDVSSDSPTVDVHGAACRDGGGGMMMAVDMLGEDVVAASFHSATLLDGGKAVKEWKFKSPIRYIRNPGQWRAAK